MKLHQSKLLHPKYILTMSENSPLIFENHSLLIQGKKIQAILTREEASSVHTNEEYILNNHILMPGLINLHGHSAMTLFRGLADDLALMDWLNNHIWPAEKKYIDGHSVYDGTLIGMAEMLLGGTTTINDMYFFHGSVAKAGLLTGMRTFVGCSILEFPTNYANNADEYIEKSLNTLSAFYGEDLIQFSLAPHAPYTVSDDTFKKVLKLSEQYNFLIHCHIHETQDEINESLKKNGKRPIERLNQLGIINERLIAAHMVHINETEIQLLQDKKISIAHNPASNMKLASGFAPIQKFLNCHINVGIGTDGAASNNKLDLFADTRLAALIAKGYSKNPTDIKAYDALKMATINGAKALHMEDKIGSIEEGKLADLIAIDISGIDNLPLFDPISQLVYSSSRENVTHVWVNGRNIVKNKQLLTVDLENIKIKAGYWQKKILDHQQ